MEILPKKNIQNVIESKFGYITLPYLWRYCTKKNTENDTESKPGCTLLPSAEEHLARGASGNVGSGGAGARHGGLPQFFLRGSP